MGWKHRDWFLAIPRHHVFDNRGNIGPTLWWDGKIIGSWTITSTGRDPCLRGQSAGVAPEAGEPDSDGLCHSQ